MDARITRDACKTRKQARKRKRALERRDPRSHWMIGRVNGASDRPWLVVEYRESAPFGSIARVSSGRSRAHARVPASEPLHGAVAKAIGGGLRRLVGSGLRAVL
jgi:hypothetical protein